MQWIPLHELVLFLQLNLPCTAASAMATYNVSFICTLYTLHYPSSVVYFSLLLWMNTLFLIFHLDILCIRSHGLNWLIKGGHVTWKLYCLRILAYKELSLCFCGWAMNDESLPVLGLRHSFVSDLELKTTSVFTSAWLILISVDLRAGSSAIRQFLSKPHRE